MDYLLILLLCILLLLNYLQSKEIKRLKQAFDFDESQLLTEAKKLLGTKTDVEVIKELRVKCYPLDLIKAKQIVDQAKKSNI